MHCMMKRASAFRGCCNTTPPSVMKYLRLLPALILSVPLCLYAHTAEETVGDSVRLDEVIVTGSRPAVDLRHMPMSVSVIDRQQIDRRYEASLLPLLTEEVPGLFITGRGMMGYGVSAGSAGQMSIRGIGSSDAGSPTTDVMVLIDGHPQSMGLMGHPLPDVYQSMLAERVEVVRGPASLLYGSNAMGGVINIITRRDEQDGVRNHARLMYGSYNTLSAEAANTVKSGRFNSFAALYYNRTDGHRPDMDFDQYGGYARLGYDLSAHWKAFADVTLTRYNSSNPGTLATPLIDNDAEVTRGMTSASLTNRYDRTSGGLSFFYNWGCHEVNDGYAPGTAPKPVRFNSRDNMLGLSWYQGYSFFRGNQTTVGLDYQRYGGEAWNRPVAGGEDIPLADEHIDDIAGYINLQQALTSQIGLNAGLRIDRNEQSGTQLIPQGGIHYSPTENTVFKALVSRGFRAPTIRELYMFAPRNPDLQAEELMNYELSAALDLLDNTLHMDAALFYINGKNIIQRQIVNGAPQYINTGKIENYGAELAARYSLNAHWNLSGNYSFLHMKYIVPAAPRHKLHLGATYATGRWSASTGLDYINHLYTDVAAESTESFLLWNLRASYRPLRILELFVRGENLLAQSYEINKGYPMPRATVFGGVTFDI